MIASACSHTMEEGGEIVKRLLIMRHAKSDWSQPGLSDHDRPLSRRGTKAAKTMGRLLAAIDAVPDHIISSSAVRAATTARLASEAGGWESTIEHTRELYGTSVEGTLRVAAGAPTTVDSLMLVGHEPTWSGVAAHLTGGSVQVKTATVVGIDCYAFDWPDLLMTAGELAFVLQPRLFTDTAWATE